MGWRGMAIGGYLGSRLGGPLWAIGAVVGAALGHAVEKRMAAARRTAGRRRAAGAPRRERPDSLDAAYAVLGAHPSDDVAELKRKYREQAKMNHPDALRAQGVPEELVGKATERMSRINEAWAAIRAARGI